MSVWAATERPVVKTLYQGKLPFLVNGGLDVIDVEDLSKAIHYLSNEIDYRTAKN